MESAGSQFDVRRLLWRTTFTGVGSNMSASCHWQGQNQTLSQEDSMALWRNQCPPVLKVRQDIVTAQSCVLIRPECRWISLILTSPVISYVPLFGGLGRHLICIFLLFLNDRAWWSMSWLRLRTLSKALVMLLAPLAT